MAWFHLPSIESLSIWLRSVKDLVCERLNLRQLHTLLLIRATINETDVPPLLSQTTYLKTLHMGIAYR